MITSIYAAILAIIIVRLSLNVIKMRRAKKVPLGDNNDIELLGAIRAQGNAIEYIPIALILMLLLELNGGYFLLLHLCGVALVVGRILHAKALHTSNIKYRVLGMQITFFTILGLAMLNVGYVFYSFLFN